MSKKATSQALHYNQKLICKSICYAFLQVPKKKKKKKPLFQLSAILQDCLVQEKRGRGAARAPNWVQTGASLKPGSALPGIQRPDGPAGQDSRAMPAPWTLHGMNRPEERTLLIIRCCSEEETSRKRKKPLWVSMLQWVCCFNQLTCAFLVGFSKEYWSTAAPQELGDNKVT